MGNKSTFTIQRHSIQLTSDSERILETDDYAETDDIKEVAPKNTDETKEKAKNFSICP